MLASAGNLTCPCSVRVSHRSLLPGKAKFINMSAVAHIVLSFAGAC